MPDSSPRIEILADRDALSRAAADEFCNLAQATIHDHGRFFVALSGGSTPRDFYALLANTDAPYRGQLAWEKMHFFWGDERHVPPDHADSNYRMAREALLSKVPLPSGNVHRIQTEMSTAEGAAQAFEGELRSFFQTEND